MHEVDESLNFETNGLKVIYFQGVETVETRALSTRGVKLMCQLAPSCLDVGVGGRPPDRDAQQALIGRDGLTTRS